MKIWFAQSREQRERKTKMQKATIQSDPVRGVLERLYADAAKHQPGKGNGPKVEAASSEEFYKVHMNQAYMCIGPDLGHLLYGLARSMSAKTIVEFGTSFGISAIYLAAALKDNGGGRLITTEFAPNKVATARENLEAAGLSDYVEFRSGDALQTLQDLPREIDIIFLDGAKELYLPVLQLLEPALRSGGLVASDNTDHDGMATFLDYLRNPSSGYVSSAGLTARHGRTSAHEISVRA